MCVSGSFTRLMLRPCFFHVGGLTAGLRFGFGLAGYTGLRGIIHGEKVTFSQEEPQEEQRQEVSLFRAPKKVD